jgi:hypothetical protein
MRIRIRIPVPRKVDFTPVWYRVLQSHIPNFGCGGLTLVAYCTTLKLKSGRSNVSVPRYLYISTHQQLYNNVLFFYILFYFKGNVGQDAGADQTAELHQPPEPQLVSLPSPRNRRINLAVTVS